MAEIVQYHRKGKKKGRSGRISSGIDFTPMVDLGFLLITFFMLATTLNKPQTMEIALPSRDQATDASSTKVKASKAITILLASNNRVYYYEGTRENGIDPVLVKTDFSPGGLRDYLVRRNSKLISRINTLKTEKESRKLSETEFERLKAEALKDKQAPIVLIKASDASIYRNLIDVLDEMAICSIDRYAIMEISPFDLDLLEKASNGKSPDR